MVRQEPSPADNSFCVVIKMASPQIEKGFTRIANEILERLVNTPLLGSEFQVLLCIIRKTYGYQNKVDIISLSQFQKATGLSRPTVVKTLKNLVTRKMVVKIYLPHDRISFSFNKNYDEWVVNISKLVKGKWVASKDVLTETSKDVLTHKRKKERIHTKEIDTPETSSGGLVSQVIKLFEEVNPATKSYYNRPPQRKACQSLIDEYGFEEVSKVIAFLPRSNKMSFVPTITTPIQLWEKYQALKDGLQRKKSELSTKGKGLA